MTNGPAEPGCVTALCQDAWAALYDQYSAGVWWYVARVIGSDSEAVADAVQETFLAAARNFGQFDPSRGTAWAWLSGIAHRQAALYWRRAGRDRISRTAFPVEEVLADDSANSPVERAETIDCVRRVLSELPSDSAAILTGKYCDDLSVADLVEQFGGTTESIRSKLARARRDFKLRYEKADGGSGPEHPIVELDLKQTRQSTMPDR